MILYVANTNAVELRTLADSATGEAVTTATVAVTLRADGVALSGADNVTLAHDTGGTYRGTLPSSVPLVDGTEYTATVTATLGLTVGQWEVPVRATTRE